MASELEVGKLVAEGGPITIKTDSSNDTPGRLNLWATDTSIVANDTIGAIHAQGTDTVTSPPEDGAKIEFNADFNWGGSTNYQASRIDFFTQDNSGTNTLLSPRLSINSTGQVNIGTGTAQKLLTLQGDDAAIRLLDTSGTNQFASLSSEGGVTKITSRNNASHGSFVFQSYNGTAVLERASISATGLASFSNGITVSGGLTSLGSFSEVTISGGGITVTSSTHRVDTQNDDPTDQLSSISGGTDGSILVLQSVTSTRDVTVTHSNGTPAQNIRLAGGVSFTLDTSNDVLVLMKYGSNWREVSRSNNS